MTTQITCPKCNAPMILRKSGKGFQFYGCSAYPKCNGYRPFKPAAIEKKVIDYSGVKGSPQQDAFWQEVLSGKTHLILKARAGSGKTFTITYILSLVQNMKIAFMAFNKHIADELKSRVPDNVLASTLHSFGFAQIRKWGKVTLDQYKLDGIIDDLYTDYEDENSDYVKGAIRKLAELCKYNLIDGTDEEAVLNLALMHSVDMNDHVSQVLHLVPRVIAESKRRKSVIDYTDMLWFVYAHNIPVEQFDIFIADEVQDFNPLQQYIAMQACKNGRIIVVGDDRQAIYGFAGADVYSMDTMEQLLGNTARGVKVMPLTYTRRCPVSHVDLAQSIVSDIEALPEAPIGSVEHVSKNMAIDMMQPGNMAICRRNAPLISIAYSLIRNGKSVIVRGRDIGKGMHALIKKMKASDIISLIEKIEAFRTRESEKLIARGKKGETALQGLNDKCDTLIALTEGLNDLSELRAKIDTLFSDDSSKGKIILSSIHRAKGLESDTVYIIEADRIRLGLSQEWQQLQEANIEYIAYTRSTDRLILVNS